MKRIYNWNNYNLKRNKEAIKNFNKNKNRKVNFQETEIYQKVRDIYAFTILMCQNKNENSNILDYGGNLMSHVNLVKKIKTKNTKISIFNPYINKLKNKTNLKINFINNLKKIKDQKFDLTFLGSVIQYLKQINNLNGQSIILRSRYILITHTPVNFSKEIIFVKQENAKNLYQTVYPLEYIEKKLLKNKFKIIFKSINDFKYLGIRKKYNNVFSTNILFKKK